MLGLLLQERCGQPGLKAELGLGGLDDSFLGFASRGWLELHVDHIWNNNVFGNGIIIQLGGRLPF